VFLPFQHKTNEHEYEFLFFYVTQSLQPYHMKFP